MIVDARELGQDQIIRTDICIIGAGPGGITLARELAKSGSDVVVLESGGKRFDRDAHELDKGTSKDPAAHGPLEDYRRRRLGGSTTAWGGRCVPFDAIDFEPREYVPHSGWPVDRSELDPYYERAHDYADLGAYSYAARDSLPTAKAPMIPGLDAPELSTESIYRFSPPTNFGAKYERHMAESTSVRVFLHATCQEVVTNPEGTLVERVLVTAPPSRKLTVIARRFVLAGGGLEVTRLLLLSNAVHKSGIGNEHDLLGRFYMCHVTHRVDVSLGDRGLIWDYERTADGVYCQRTLAVTERGQRELGLLNHRARVEHPEIANPDHLSGVLSATYLAKSILMRQAANPLLSDKVNVLSKGVTTQEVVRPLSHVKNVVTDFGRVLAFSRRWVTQRILAERKLPSLVMSSATQVYTLRIDAEQVPNEDSRITLGHERDANGARRLLVDWRHTAYDAESLQKTSELIDRALRASGVGTASWAPPERLQATGGHHIGTTRMASDPKRGVVDQNCQVHGVDNLFVASSSIFPTCSYANPTLTILAFALRLADHLRRT